MGELGAVARKICARIKARLWGHFYLSLWGRKSWWGLTVHGSPLWFVSWGLIEGVVLHSGVIHRLESRKRIVFASE